MRDFKKYFKLEASPADLYNALTNPMMIEIWTGETAVMSTEPGSEFSLWDGEIVGRNIEFVQDQKIVQSWFFGEESDSVVTIKLHPDKQGTNVEVHQTNIPDEAYDNIAEGWESDYIGSLKELFDKTHKWGKIAMCVIFPYLLIISLDKEGISPVSSLIAHNSF